MSSYLEDDIKEYLPSLELSLKGYKCDKYLVWSYGRFLICDFPNGQRIEGSDTSLYEIPNALVGTDAFTASAFNIMCEFFYGDVRRAKSAWDKVMTGVKWKGNKGVRIDICDKRGVVYDTKTNTFHAESNVVIASLPSRSYTNMVWQTVKNVIVQMRMSRQTEFYRYKEHILSIDDCEISLDGHAYNYSLLFIAPNMGLIYLIYALSVAKNQEQVFKSYLRASGVAV